MTEEAIHRLARARVGQVLRNKWRIDGLLGVGGMAAVYAATHRNGKRAALKVLHLDAAADTDVRRRFLREGYVANKVGHPGVVSVLDDDVGEDGAVFLVLELLEGETVEQRAARAPLSLGEVLDVAGRLLDVVSAAHEKGIVHRDIKPENVFLTREGGLKVLDFGIARLREAGSGRATTTGATFGTPAFLPPEQALGNQVDARTDVWAVGATMFYLLTGRFVHDAPTVQKVMLAAMTRSPPRIQAIRADLPATVAAVVDRALAFDPGKRWGDAASMRDAIRSLALSPAERASLPAPRPAGAATSPLTSASSFARRRRLRIWTRVAFVAAALAAGLAAWVWFRAPDATGPQAAPHPSSPGASSAPKPPPTPIAASAIATGVGATPGSPASADTEEPASAAPEVTPAPVPPTEKAMPRRRAPAARPQAPSATADPFGRW
jgi:eukaryotic-like serine/threonine-protein kinase